MLEAVICGETEIPARNFMSELKKLKKYNSETHRTGLEAQFRLLFQLTPDPNEVLCNTAKAHTDKNRSNDFLPSKSCIFILNH